MDKWRGAMEKPIACAGHNTQPTGFSTAPQPRTIEIIDPAGHLPTAPTAAAAKKYIIIQRCMCFLLAVNTGLW